MRPVRGHAARRGDAPGCARRDPSESAPASARAARRGVLSHCWHCLGAAASTARNEADSRCPRRLVC
eukprot:scaffold233583_cov28-Tisochrysis_lutea.AAC.1